MPRRISHTQGVYRDLGNHGETTGHKQENSTETVVI